MSKITALPCPPPHRPIGGARETRTHKHGRDHCLNGQGLLQPLLGCEDQISQFWVPGALTPPAMHPRSAEGLPIWQEEGWLEEGETPPARAWPEAGGTGTVSSAARRKLICRCSGLECVPGPARPEAWAAADPHPRSALSSQQTQKPLQRAWERGRERERGGWDVTGNQPRGQPGQELSRSGSEAHPHQSGSGTGAPILCSAPLGRWQCGCPAQTRARSVEYTLEPSHKDTDGTSH